MRRRNKMNPFQPTFQEKNFIWGNANELKTKKIKILKIKINNKII